MIVYKYGNSNSQISFYNKSLDFKDWEIIVNLYYLGNHSLPEGKCLINKIKSRMNNYRLSNNKYLNLVNISERGTKF